jgi:threonylcarbamoyladenosine tRNA methylthiotransferase MtaB
MVNDDGKGVNGRAVYLDFVGCRLNQAEIERMGRQFAARGDVLVDDPADADLVVVNTCAVTTTAARKSRQAVRQAGRANGAAQIIATGCYAELSPERLSDLPGVARVVGNASKDNLVALIRPDAPDYEQEPLLREPLPPGTLGRTRAFVKVQDGCDNRCTFCVTTLARGEGRSRAPGEIVGEINLLVGMGYREVVLTGVHLGSYGHDLPGEADLRDLVAAILQHTDAPRVRLSSLEPWDLSPDFFDLWADDRLCPHLHLPLQSGSDATLRRMARRTTCESFAVLVAEARARIPRLAVTTDLIVGFPGETDSDFDESLDFVEQMAFARLHVFPYSRRPGTAAARMADQVPADVRKARKAKLLALSDRLWESFQMQHVGQVHEVLWESARGATPEGFVWSGLTGNYLRVVMTTPDDLANTITQARLTGLGNEGIAAEIA